jgi:hypothetical protein
MSHLNMSYSTKVSNDDIQRSVRECLCVSLAYELRRHYGLLRYPWVDARVEVNRIVRMYPTAPYESSLSESTYVIRTVVNRIEYTTPKDHFVMSLRDSDSVIAWLNERADLIGKGIIRELVRRCDTLYEDPEDVINSITAAMGRV